MLLKRQFTVVLPDGTTKTIDYDGNQTTITF
jgi:alpha-D-xyloside xylohydrolase